VAFRR